MKFLTILRAGWVNNRVSRSGLVISGITLFVYLIVGLWLVIQKQRPWWIILIPFGPSIALFIRSLFPPVGFFRGLAVFLGGNFLVNGPLIAFFELESAALPGFVVYIVSGIFLLRYGFSRRPAITETQTSPEHKHSNEPDKICTGKKKSIPKGNVFELPEGLGWWEIPRRGETNINQCPTCHNKVEFSGHGESLSCKSEAGVLTFTGNTAQFTKPGIIKLAKIFAYLLSIGIGTLIGSVLLKVPFLWILITAIAIVPLKMTLELSATLIGGKVVNVWSFKCNKCQKEMFIASSEYLFYFSKGTEIASSGPEAAIGMAQKQTKEKAEEKREKPVPEESTFSMKIEDKFFIKNKGPVVTGTVRRGMLQVGDKVEIITLQGRQKAIVEGIVKYRKHTDIITIGESAGIMLKSEQLTKDFLKNHVKIGDLLCSSTDKTDSPLGEEVEANLKSEMNDAAVEGPVVTKSRYKIPKAEVTIDRPYQDVWSFFVAPKNWEKWWGGTLQKVEPGWQSGATLVWANGNKSRVASVIPGREVLLANTFMKNIFRFTPLEGATLVENEFEAAGGASFSDGGRAERAKRTSRLEKLKQCIESERSVRTSPPSSLVNNSKNRRRRTMKTDERLIENKDKQDSVLACQFCGKHLRKEPVILAVKTSGGLVGNILKNMQAEEELSIKRSCDSCGSIFCLECSKAQAAKRKSSGEQCPKCGTKVLVAR